MIPYLEDHPMNCKCVNNHGDWFRPLRIGLWDPFQMAVLWLIVTNHPWTPNHEKWRFSTSNIWVITPKNEGCGFPWHLLTGMILQVQYLPVSRYAKITSLVDMMSSPRQTFVGCACWFWQNSLQLKYWGWRKPCFSNKIDGVTNYP